MKKHHIYLWATLILVTISCSKESAAESDENQEAEVSYREPLNSSGMLEFNLFQGNSSSTGKVIEGSDNDFNYVGYGQFRLNPESEVFIPKNIEVLNQYNPDTGVLSSIKLDQYLIPREMRSITPGNLIDTIISLDYNAERTLITFETEDQNGLRTLVETYSFEGIVIDEQSSKGYRDEDSCTPFVEEPNKQNFICGDNAWFTEMLEFMKSRSRLNPLYWFGAGFSWIVDTAKEKICNDESIPDFKSQPFSCEDYLITPKSYVKFLDTGEVYPFFSQLERIQCPNNPRTLYLYWLNFQSTEPCSESPEVANPDLNTASVYSFIGQNGISSIVNGAFFTVRTSPTTIEDYQYYQIPVRINNGSLSFVGRGVRLQGEPTPRPVELKLSF